MIKRILRLKWEIITLPLFISICLYAMCYHVVLNGLNNLGIEIIVHSLLILGLYVAIKTTRKDLKEYFKNK